MSFKINDLIVQVSKDVITCPPKITCFNTEITNIQILESALGPLNPLVESINSLNAQIKGDPTDAQLKLLEEKLKEAIEILRPNMK